MGCGCVRELGGLDSSHVLLLNTPGTPHIRKFHLSLTAQSSWAKEINVFKKVGPALWVPPGPGLRDMLVSGAQRQAAGPASGPGLRRPWRGPCFLPGACARRTSAWACRCQAHNCELLGSDTSLVPTGSDSVILTIVGLESSGY